MRLPAALQARWNMMCRCSTASTPGTVTGSSYYTGGIAGYVSDAYVGNCLNTGDVTDSTATGGVVGSNYGAVTNCFYLDTAYSGGIYGADVEGAAEAVTEAQLTSGQVAYLLGQGCTASYTTEEYDENGNTVEVTHEAELPGDAWGQSIGTDDAPVLDGTKKV